MVKQAEQNSIPSFFIDNSNELLMLGLLNKFNLEKIYCG